MKLYHVTKLENVQNILKHGLIPYIGNNSKIIDEKSKRIYLCDFDSIPYWSVICKGNVVLSIDIDESKMREYDFEVYKYTLYKEFITTKSISSKYIKIINYKINNVTINYINKNLCSELLYKLSRFCSDCARYYNYNYGNYDFKEHLKIGAKLIIHMNNVVDFSRYDKEKIKKDMIEFGNDGEYTCFDTYFNTSIRLYQILPYYRDDELSEYRKLISEYYRKILDDININTGGFC